MGKLRLRPSKANHLKLRSYAHTCVLTHAHVRTHTHPHTFTHMPEPETTQRRGTRQLRCITDPETEPENPAVEHVADNFHVPLQGGCQGLPGQRRRFLVSRNLRGAPACWLGAGTEHRDACLQEALALSPLCAPHVLLIPDSGLTQN